MSALFAVTATTLDLDEHVRAVADPHAGAVVTFVGQVRDHDADARGRVTELEYSAHPDAERILGEIVAACIPADVPVAVSHRVGELRVGDAAIIACVATAHRAEAFALCGELVDRVKAELPVWKRQRDDAGRTTWVGLS